MLRHQQTPAHLEGELCSKGELVFFKQSPADVVEGGERHAVYEHVYSALYVLTDLRRFHCLVENNIEGL